VGDVAKLQEVDALHPADGARDLADEGVADGVGLLEELGVDVAGYREAGMVEGDGLELVLELQLGRHHERAVEGATDREHDGALGAEFFAEFCGSLDGGLGAGDDGLIG